MEILREAVAGACAWSADAMAASDDWRRRLDDAECDEVDAALAHARSRELDPLVHGRDAFPLTRVAELLHHLGEELETGRGFVLLRGLRLDGRTTQDIRTLYAGLAAHLGRVITQNRRGDRIGEVTDRGGDYGRTAVRGHTSSDAIAPHCDSADVVGLLCVHPAASGGESTVASATSIYNALLAEHPEYLEVLCRGFRINLAGKGPSGEPAECSNHVIPVFSYHAGRLSCRYNRKQIEDAAAIRGETLSPLERAAIARVGELALADRLRLDMDFRRGDLQLLNNHVILHARRAYRDGAEPRQRRLLLRIWVNVDAGRPLAPDFADRLNTGPRGEVAVQQTQA